MAPPSRKGPMFLGASISGLVVFFALCGLTQLVAPSRVLLFSPLVEMLVVLAAALVAIYVLLSLAMILATIFGDQYALASG